MSAVQYPAGWKHDTRLHELLAAAMVEAGCGWTQTCSTLAFALACMIAAHEEREVRDVMITVTTGMVRKYANEDLQAARRLQ